MDDWLESLVPWGTEFIVGVQSWTGNWRDLFHLFSMLGYEEFYLFLLPFVYWCVSKPVGLGLGYIAMLSTWLNDAVKYVFRIPRPADARIVAPWPETSPSFPSGHSQNAVADWGYLGLQLRNRPFAIVSVVLMVLISFSRLVIGVHFPQDVLGGWAIGIVLLATFAWAVPRVMPWFGRQSLAVQLPLALVFPLPLIFLHPADTNGLYPAEGALTPGGALVGLGIGAVMERAWLRFRVDGELWRRGLRLLLGLAIVIGLYAGPKMILPAEMPYGVEAVVRFGRYVLLAWATAFFCPWLFVKLHLAGQEGPAPQVPAGRRPEVTIDYVQPA